MSGPKRNITESYEAQASLDKAHEEWIGAGIAWEAVLEVLMNDPGFGVALNESGKLRTFTFQGAISTDTPTIQVIYEDNPPYLEVIDLMFMRPERYVQYHH